jgi:hypothetical protein
MKYEILHGQTVTNTIIASAEFMAQAYPEGNYREVAGDVSTPPATVAHRHIAVGAFFDRFGAHKWPILADTTPVVQALIKDCSVRPYVDLDRNDLLLGLGLLVEAGHAIDVQSIVTAAVQDGERP